MRRLRSFAGGLGLVFLKRIGFLLQLLVFAAEGFDFLAELLNLLLLLANRANQSFFINT